MPDIDLVPTPAVAAGILAGPVLFAWLVALSHGPWKIRAPGRRFVAAALLTAGGFAVLAAFVGSGSIDVLAGALIVATVLIAGFTAWTLVAWGFTLSMLLALARAGGGLTLDALIAAYTGGLPIETFSGDRLSVLFRLKFAEGDADGRVRATPRGRRLARFASFLRRAFGISA